MGWEGADGEATTALDTQAAISKYLGNVMTYRKRNDSYKETKLRNESSSSENIVWAKVPRQRHSGCRSDHDNYRQIKTTMINEKLVECMQEHHLAITYTGEIGIGILLRLSVQQVSTAEVFLLTTFF